MAHKAPTDIVACDMKIAGRSARSAVSLISYRLDEKRDLVFVAGNYLMSERIIGATHPFWSGLLPSVAVLISHSLFTEIKSTRRDQR